MKRPLGNLMRVAAITVASLVVNFANAQTFTQQVQQHHAGEGTVTIHHDDAIDRLVNATSTERHTTPANPATVTTPAKKAKPAESTAPAKPAAPTKTTTTAKPATPTTATSASKPAATKSRPQTDTTKSRPQTDTTRQRPQPDTTVTVPAVPDTTVTTPTTRHGYKTTGYRVQAFAGGNTRNDRQKAERTGNAIRQLLPGEDVYVRFYSPRWVCRVGNYRTYEEAHEKMLLIRKLGYESATIVKGKIVIYHD